MTDLFQVLGVINHDLDTHLHSEFVEVHVQTGNLSALDSQWHLLGDSGGLSGVTLDQLGFQGTFTVALGDLNALQGVFEFTI